MRPKHRQGGYDAGLSLRPISNWLLLLAVIAVAAAGTGLTWWLLSIAGADPNSTAAVRIDAIRTGLSAAVGTGGAFALLLAFRRQRSTEISAVHAIIDATERRVTELYTKAADQLGSDKAPVRLAGLYALERLAQDNPAQRQTIANVICSYLQMPYAPIEATPLEPPTANTSEAGGATSEDGNRADQLREYEKQLQEHEKRTQEHRVRSTALRVLQRHLASSAAVQLRWNTTIDLSGASLVRAKFDGADLVGADLSEASLLGAFLHQTNLSKAVLHKADLTRADLRQAVLLKASLLDANLTDARCEMADFSEATLTDANLSLAVLNGAKLTKVDLTGARFVEASLDNTDLTEACLIGANLTKAFLGRANLSNARCSNTNLTRAVLYGANLSGTSFNEADLTGADLHDADLTGASLAAAKLGGANVGGVIWTDKTAWPTEYQDEVHAASTQIEAEPETITFRVRPKYRIPPKAASTTRAAEDSSDLDAF